MREGLAKQGLWPHACGTTKTHTKAQPMVEHPATSFPKHQIKVLLLENVAATALEIFGGEGYQVEHLKTALPADELPLANNVAVASLGELLRVADFVTLHVAETRETRDMMGAAELAKMKPGSFLLNASRGTVVVIPALVDALTRGHLAGAAV